MTTEQNKLEALTSGHPSPPQSQPFPPPHHTISVPHSGSDDSSAPPTHGYLHDNQTFSSFKVAIDEENQFRCCGLDGWGLFILGFFLFSIPWFIGAIIFLFMICSKSNLKGKFGYAACFIGAIVISIVVDSIQSAICTHCSDDMHHLT